MSFSETRQSSVQHPDGVAVVVDTQEKRLIEESKRLSYLLGEPGPKPTYTLYFGAKGIELRTSNNVNHSGQRVDFLSIDRRVGAGNLSKKQPLPKAIGEHKLIVDATAGFGMDAARLSLMGYDVIAIEQSPVISAMLRDGLYRAQQDAGFSKAIGGRLTIVESNSTKHLLGLSEIEVVYIDPMFPQKRKKSALPPGNIQALQSIVGHEDPLQTEQLFETAMQTATQRVVVKRPTYAPHLGTKPVAVHEGKLVRYEVYRPDQSTT